MSSNIKKGNMHRSDYDRALVTDTLPAEVPIIFSNDGFYKNQKNRSYNSIDLEQILKKILNPREKSYAIPYRYRITKNALATRRLSLLHPRSQLEICEFYKRYEELICYYNSQSSFSIRAAQKIGTTYFFKCSASEKNKYKGASIDTLPFEKRVRNPASFFSYNGFDKFYKFFESSLFLRLEKKFSYMWLADVSKCFDSIYTHTLPWAIKDMQLSKKEVSNGSFGMDFDKLMQRQNYNETNGIAIGPELSRIFAETIFQKIDLLVMKKASDLGLLEKVDYQCVRYVDDIIIFAKSEVIAGKIYSFFEDYLADFNLHLNEQKLEKYHRPFQTKKSHVILKVQDTFGHLQRLLLKEVSDESGSYQIPSYLRNKNAIKIDFVKRLKATCYEANASYEMSTNYTIACIVNLIERTIDSYGSTPDTLRPSEARYINAIYLMLDLLFFLYTLQPTVISSFRISRSIVLSLRFITKYTPEKSVFFTEQLTQWTYELVRSFDTDKNSVTRKKIPVELLNIFLAISEGDNDGLFPSKFIDEVIIGSENPDYFSIVSFLFFAKRKRKYLDIKYKVEEFAIKYFNENADVLMSSHDAHLFLDLASCPYIRQSTKARIIQKTNSKLGLPSLSLAKCSILSKELEVESWFVNWKEVDLLNFIKRKELSSVY